MKTVFAALCGAVGTTIACWRIILILWIVTASAAWIFASPLRTEIMNTYAHSPMASGLLQTFDNESFVDFWSSESDPVGQSSALLSRSIFCWIILWTILSAGVLARVADKKRFDGFLSSCARYAHRFIWLLAMSLLAWFALGWANDHLSIFVTTMQADQNSSSASFLGWSMTIKTLFMLALVGIALTAGRFARLRVVLLQERFVVLSWFRALSAVIRHLPSIGLGRILSLWPIVMAFLGYKWGTEAVMAGWEIIPGLRLEWQLVLVMQASQILLIAALVYRMAVDARLWVIVAPHATATDPAPKGLARGGKTHEAPLASTGASRTGIVGVFLLLSFAGQVEPQDAVATPTTEVALAAKPRSDQRNAYVMNVTVDIEGRSVSGTEHATFINKTSKPVNELWLHLYASAFSNTHTTWIQGNREEAIRERGEELGGYLDIRSVKTATGEDLSERTSIDDTLMKVSLEKPVPAGASIELVIDFETRFPDVVARMGQIGHHIDGMQWYPKFCAHDEDGWKNRPFYRMGEFFADFGSYDVTFHYPMTLDGETVILEATGEPGLEESDGKNSFTRRYTAQDVHDFAFCADTSFVRYESTFQDPVSGRTVDIVYLCQPYAEPKAEQVLSVMQTCLRAASEWWMPYPYSRIVIDGLPHSLGGGMEYPMLFTISQQFPNHLEWFVNLTEAPANVTAHEFGHQYWYGILASDEVEEAWLDEGINTWGTTKLIEEHWPDEGQTNFLTFLDRKLVREAFNGKIRGKIPLSSSELSLQSAIGWKTSPFHNTPPSKPAQRATLLGYTVPDINSLRLPDMSANRPAWWKSSYRPVADARPLKAPSRDFTTGYGGLVYRKTALVLETLERHVGTETMDKIMKTYVQRFAFKHPTGEDFLQVVHELTDGLHDELLRQFIDTSGTVDWTVEEVKTTRIEDLEGYASQHRPGDPVTWQALDLDGGDGTSGSRQEGPLLQGAWAYLFTTPYPGSTSDSAGDPDAAIVPDSQTQDEAPGQWLSRYVVRQLGDIEAPVVVEARFADGSTLANTWDGVGGYKLFEHKTSSKLLAVEVDPERLFLIDLNVNNNGRVLEPNHETTRALAAYSQFWTQNVLSAWSLVF
jgi:hypothetical protein